LLGLSGQTREADTPSDSYLSDMISRTALHAVRAMAVLADQPKNSYVGAGEIAEVIDAPRNYLGKLLQTLAEEGLVESQKGKGGGFRLARRPSAVSLYDIVEPIDHISRWQGCFMGRQKCSGENPCAVHSRWQIVRDSYLAFLRETTLDDLASQPDKALLAGI
jgi:Rrf2 family protein